jgi:hypothetical protein
MEIAGLTTLIIFISFACAGVITIVSLGAMGFFIYRAFGGVMKNNNVLKTGVSAPGVILSVQDTGGSMNDNPQARIRLRVMPSGQEAFEAETTMYVGRFQIAMFVPNAAVMVRYDPADTTKVAIETVNGMPAGF